MLRLFFIFIFSFGLAPKFFANACDPYGVAAQMERLARIGVALPEPQVLIRIEANERAKIIGAYISKFVNKKGIGFDRFKDSVHVGLTYLVRAQHFLDGKQMASIWVDMADGMHLAGAGGGFSQTPFYLKKGIILFLSPNAHMLFFTEDGKIYRGFYRDFFPEVIPEDELRQIEQAAEKKLTIPEGWTPDFNSPLLQEIK